MNLMAKRLDAEEQTEYPVFGIVACIVLLMIAPFVSRLIPLVVFGVCVMRIVMHGPRVFAIDYCLLIPISSLFCLPSGMSLLIWLCLVAMIWYLIRGQITGSVTLVFLLVLLNYLLLRMQMNINAFVLCFGHMAMLYVIMDTLDESTVKRALRGFLLSLLIASVYAFVFRNNYRIIAIVGAEGDAILGTDIRRFKGLYVDPNYYMTLLVIGLASLLKLKKCELVRLPLFLFYFVSFTAFGVLTYSKTFFLMFVLLCGITVLWQFWDRKIFKGMVFTLLAVGGLLYLIYSPNSPFAVVMARLTTSKDLDVVTTGRTDVFAMYWRAISEDWGTFLFGHGLAAEGLRKDPHNLYLEIMYYIGFVGTLLYFALCIAIFARTARNAKGLREQRLISKFLVISIMAIMYISLNGMFLPLFHSELFLALLSMMIVNKKEEEPEYEHSGAFPTVD